MIPSTLHLIRECMQVALKLSDAEASTINETSTPLEFPQWTSAAHLELLLSVEQRAGVMFEADELGRLASVQAIGEALERKRSN
jgi:acyl carrier protein